MLRFLGLRQPRVRAKFRLRVLRPKYSISDVYKFSSCSSVFKTF